MKRHAIVLPLLAVALVPQVRTPTELIMHGAWVLQPEASDNVTAQINRAVPTAAGRKQLRTLNPVYRQVSIRFPLSHIRITMDYANTMASPPDGRPVRYRREDGKMVSLSTEWENGRLEQSFKADDGERLNVFSVSPGGSTLTMDVTLTGFGLKEDLTYTLVYRRDARY